MRGHGPLRAYHDYVDLRRLKTAPKRPPLGRTRVYVLDSDGDAYQLEQDGTQTILPGAGGSSITVSENFLTSAVTIAATNTFYDGPSLSLAAGTYLLDACVTIDVQTSAHFTAKIWDGSTLMSPTPEHFHATSGGQLTMTIPGYVVLGSTTTVKVSVAANNGTNNAIDNTGVTNATANKSSYLRATKIA